MRLRVKVGLRVMVWLGVPVRLGVRSNEANEQLNGLAPCMLRMV